jgi:hypothetical protein
MKTINLEISEDSAREMLTILQRKQADAQSKADAYGVEIRKIKKGLGMVAPPPPKPIATRASVATESSPPSIVRSEGTAGIIEKTPTGKIKKGQSKQIVLNFLKSKNGAGATIKGISSETGTNYGTVRRVLADLKDEMVINEDGGLWKWGKSEFV